MSQLRIARLRDIRYTTIQVSRKQANTHQDYLLNYKVINGKRDTQSPLTPYQSWVLSRIQIVMKALKKADRVEARTYALTNLARYAVIEIRKK
jgi:hypothetical protein